MSEPMQQVGKQVLVTDMLIDLQVAEESTAGH